MFPGRGRGSWPSFHVRTAQARAHRCEVRKAPARDLALPGKVSAHLTALLHASLHRKDLQADTAQVRRAPVLAPPNADPWTQICPDNAPSGIGHVLFRGTDVAGLRQTERP